MPPPRTSSWLSLLILVLISIFLSFYFSSRFRGSASEKKSLPSLAATNGATTEPVSEPMQAYVPVLPEVVNIENATPLEKRAYLLKWHESRLVLEQTNDLRGDFKPKRGPLPWEPGMWYFRLLDRNQRVLAEETMSAPDHNCLVLDPFVTDAKGNPQAAALTPQGPVVFQVRMRNAPGATHLEVFRITGERPANPQTPAAVSLLATIPIER